MIREGRTRQFGDSNDPLFSQAVHKAFAVLEVFGGEKRALTLGEMAESVGMTKSSAQRCAHTLERLGYLQRSSEATGWTLTPRSLATAFAYLRGYPLLETATARLIELNQATGESVSLSEPDGVDMVFIARFPSLKRFNIHMPVGQRLPMYCTASGRAYLSHLPSPEAVLVVKQSSLYRHTPTTIVDPVRIMNLVHEAKSLGFAWSNQEIYTGDLTIAAPIVGLAGRPIAAVNISAPASRWTIEQMRLKLAPLLIEAASVTSRAIA